MKNDFSFCSFYKLKELIENTCQYNMEQTTASSSKKRPIQRHVGVTEQNAQVRYIQDFDEKEKERMKNYQAKRKLGLTGKAKKYN